MGLFNPDLFNGPELFNTGEDDTPGPIGHKPDVKVEVKVEEELVSILVTVAFADCA